MEGIERSSTLEGLHGSGHGLTPGDREKRRHLYGRNEMVVPLESLLVLLGKELLTPFYVFQVFSLTWWTIDKETLKKFLIECI